MECRVDFGKRKNGTIVVGTFCHDVACERLPCRALPVGVSGKRSTNRTPEYSSDSLDVRCDGCRLSGSFESSRVEGCYLSLLPRFAACLPIQSGPYACGTENNNADCRDF